MKTDKAYTICPDDNIIAQFIEGTLNEQDEDKVLRHLDCCEICRTVVNFALEVELENDESVAVESNPFSQQNEIPPYHAAGKNGASSAEEISQSQTTKNANTCAIKIQQLILSDFGIHISEKQLVNEALQEGWYCKNKGMLLEHVGKTLNKHGIETQRKLNAALNDLSAALQENSKVIVAVDSGELWCDSWDEYKREMQEDLVEEIPDHVVLIEDLLTEKTTIVGVLIKDPVLFDGVKSVAIDVFMNAWQDSDFFMIKTVQ